MALLLLQFSAVTRAALASPGPSPNPLAAPAAMVHCDRFSRFSVISPVLIRAEFAPAGDGAFEDRATLAFVNRRLPVPAFTVHNASGWCNVTIAASGVQMAYRTAAATPGGHNHSRPPCIYGPPLKGQFLPGCAAGGAPPAPPPCPSRCKDPLPSLAAAQAMCNNLTGCGGVTLHLGKYEARHGPAARPCPSDAPPTCCLDGSSWVLTNAAQCRGDPVSHSGFADHRLTLSLHGKVVWQAGVTTATEMEANQRGGAIYQLNGMNGSHSDIGGPTQAIDMKCQGQTSTTIYGPRNPSEFIECTPGVLSYGGWAVYSDQDNTVLDQQTEWWAPSAHFATGGEDLYLFAPGKDQHMPALRALAAVSGKTAVPPRRFFGVWWSRWNKYTELELRELAEDYESNSIPLDGICLDTEWHRNMVGYLDGSGAPWYSGMYDWDQSLYDTDHDIGGSPAMVDWMEARGLAPVHQDIHQAATLPANSHFAELAAALGRPANESVPLEIGDKTYVTAWFKLIDAQVGGRNYWWLDSPHSKNGLDNNKTNLGSGGLAAELWNRHIFWQACDEAKVGRPSVMGPFGGLGTHRMPNGHSGDTVTSWQTLQFLPVYSATASNALFSYISHDLGGHRDYGDGNDQELCMLLRDDAVLRDCL